MQGYREALQPLLSAINCLAPDGEVQRKFVNHLHEMEDNNCSQKEIMQQLIRRLHDGVAFGNW